MVYTDSHSLLCSLGYHAGAGAGGEEEGPDLWGSKGVQGVKDPPNRVTVATHLGGQLSITPSPRTTLPCTHPHTLNDDRIDYAKDKIPAHKELHATGMPWKHFHAHVYRAPGTHPHTDALPMLT